MAATLLALGLALVSAAPASAGLGPIRLFSKSATEQADEALAPALSADGHYLAFQGTIGGLSGVFRKDLQSGEIAPVVAGSAYEEGSSGSDAGAPSISADGRFVSFTTIAPLDPADDLQSQSSDVYVADMDASPPTYELASALNALSTGLSYAGSGGSVASSQVALSADGRKVAFVTTAPSNLTSGPGGSTEGEETPAGQVVVRDLETRQTTLVSVERDPAGNMTALPVAGGAVLERNDLPLLAGAALSADATTVAWLGVNLQDQVPLLADEAATISLETSASAFPYDEPLWRRLADGPGSPTRRIVGGGDPLAPGCPPGGTFGDPACRGPFSGLSSKNTDLLNSALGWLGVPRVDGVPRLSADGRTVALIGNPTEATNVFLVDMGAGSSRVEAVHQLTREVSIDPANPASVVNQERYIPQNGHVFDLAISADGRQIAFATARQQFPLAPPNLVGSAPVQLGLVELYLIDLDGETLQRITHGDGGPGEASLASTGLARDGAGAISPSFGAGSRLIAFASTASNLVEGDGNDGSDAFLVERSEAARLPGAVTISPPPPARKRKPGWRLTLSAFSLPSGRVRLLAVVPGAGALRARAEAVLGAGSSPRTLAHARTRHSGSLALTLGLPRRYRQLARSREGLYANVRVGFHGRGGKPLHGELEARFRVHRRERPTRGARG
jgi:Tol biopolymer transport system component